MFQLQKKKKQLTYRLKASKCINGMDLYYTEVLLNIVQLKDMMYNLVKI